MDIHCSQCGTTIDQEKPKCSGCGAIQESFVYKSRIAAATLALFTGIFGGHRFFLGQWWGLFYLLFFWTYIPWLVSLVEGIVFLSTSQKNWNEKYNQGISVGTEKGAVVVIMACIVPAIAVIGILAAVAIPAYHDYTTRAKLVSSMNAAIPVRSAIENYAITTREWPTNIHQLNDLQLKPFEHINSIDVQDGVIYIEPATSLQLSGYLIYVPSSTESGISWSCKESTIEKKYLPQACR